MAVWNDLVQHPLCGSQTHLSLGFSYFISARAILPDLVRSYDDTIDILTRVEPFRARDFARYQERTFLERFQSMGVHLAKAAELSRQAVELADPREPIGLAHYPGVAVPTKRAYAELNHAPIAIADTFCRLRTNMLAAYHLLKEIDAATAAGDTALAAGKERAYHALIHEDIAVRTRFIALLTKFSTMNPALTRTSLSEAGIAKQIAYMETEIARMNTYLAQQPDRALQH